MLAESFHAARCFQRCLCDAQTTGLENLWITNESAFWESMDCTTCAPLIDSLLQKSNAVLCVVFVGCSCAAVQVVVAN